MPGGPHRAFEVMSFWPEGQGEMGYVRPLVMTAERRRETFELFAAQFKQHKPFGQPLLCTSDRDERYRLSVYVSLVQHGTAASALWADDQERKVYGWTVLLCRIDKSDDYCVMERVADKLERITPRDGKPVRFAEEDLAAPLLAERPVAATYFASIEAARSNLLHGTIDILADAFFSQFGITGSA